MIFNSKDYWEKRYLSNGNSGNGSYGVLCDFKTKIINDFIIENNIKSIIDFGCGDGNQLKNFICENYCGIDVSETIINKNKIKFKDDNTKCFYMYDDYNGQKFDLSLSLDVIYHLVEDDIFVDYMNKLFISSNNFVIIYSSNGDVLGELSQHIRDRIFTKWIDLNKPNFYLYKKIDNIFKYDSNIKEINTSISDFYIYKIK